jgi:DtxR family Mn-dependent transcriptional regulator
MANKVIRRRRLWEVFLVEQLGLSLAMAEDAACALEHVTTDEVVAHLAAYLDYPSLCPHRRPIPAGPDAEALRTEARPTDQSE